MTARRETTARRCRQSSSSQAPRQCSSCFGRQPGSRQRRWASRGAARSSCRPAPAASGTATMSWRRPVTSTSPPPTSSSRSAAASVSRDNIAAFEALADRLGAVLGSSRPLADAGWMPPSRQVGQSGNTVKPKLYLAFAISGAMQHVAGMKGSGTVGSGELGSGCRDLRDRRLRRGGGSLRRGGRARGARVSELSELVLELLGLPPVDVDPELVQAVGADAPGEREAT